MSDLIIPCLTVWQPYASLMAEGLKAIETRGYPASRLGLQPGQLVAIHAAKRPMTWGEKQEWEEFLRGRGIYVRDLPYGAVLSVHRFKGDHQSFIFKHYRATYGFTEQEEMFGDYSDGRYGWLMPRVLQLTPRPHRGQQGIGRWTVPAEVAVLLE